MANYYVPKKNRCPGCLTIGNGNLTFATSSSMNTNSVTSRMVYNVSKSQQTSAVIQKKGSGNIKKHGSGGNSYAAYLAKKTGNILCCDCCQQLTFEVTAGAEVIIGATVTGNISGNSGIIQSISGSAPSQVIIIKLNVCSKPLTSADDNKIDIGGEPQTSLNVNTIVECP